MRSISGEVFSGLKEAQDYLSFESYQKRIKQAAGFRPFPGTLNLRVNANDLGELKEGVNSEYIEEFEYKNNNCSALDVYPVTIADKDAAYIDVKITDYNDNVMEVVAPVNLRSEFGLSDGDKVEIKY